MAHLLSRADRDANSTRGLRQDSVVLADITPVILTRNEAPKMERALNRLSCARDIVIVDSFSYDDTAASPGHFTIGPLFNCSFDLNAQQFGLAVKA